MLFCFFHCCNVVVLFLAMLCHLLCDFSCAVWLLLVAQLFVDVQYHWKQPVDYLYMLLFQRTLKSEDWLHQIL